jgi:hypothetical protein
MTSVKNIFLASAGIKLGKTVIALGLATNYPRRVGYYKPFGETMIKSGDETMDQDALLMSNVFNMESGSKLSPFTYDIFNPVTMNDIVAKHGELSQGKDLMIIEGGREPSTGFAHGISNTDIAKALKVPLIVVSTTSRQSLDMVIITKNLCEQKGLEMLGVIFNKTADSPKRFLEDRGIRVLGEVPMIPELMTFKIPEVLEKMNARIIAGASGMGRVVETTMLGTSTMQSAAIQMRKLKRKALITGGDRTELLIAALSTDTSCIIVTGEKRPASTVLSRADSLGVPVLMTDEQTIHVAEILDHLMARIDPEDKTKIDAIKESVRSGIDMKTLWS